jgi:hypothetical protein
MTNTPEHGLDKLIWTDADFDRMGWHDSYIHGFHSGLRPERGEFDFLIDLDYIVRWIDPTPPSEYFSFLIAPATLVFHGATEIKITITHGGGDIRVDGLSRVAERLTPNGIDKDYHWVFEPGVISLWATGFTQYFRRPSVRMRRQWLELEERGGVSFAKGMTDEKDA